MCAGNTAEAARRLKADGVNITLATLENWKNRSKREAYAQVRDEPAPQIRARIAAQCEDAAQQQARVSQKLLERFEQEIPNLRASDAAGALRNLETSKAINIDKALILRNQPTAIVERRSLDESPASS